MEEHKSLAGRSSHLKTESETVEGGNSRRWPEMLLASGGKTKSSRQ